MPDQRFFDFESTRENTEHEKARATRGAEQAAHLETSKREVEQALADAERLGLSDPAAGPAFEYAERLAVACADMEIQMRVFARLAAFHERRGSIRLAREKCRIALQNAECLTVVCNAAVEKADRLRYESLRLENHQSQPFKNLTEIAQKTDPYAARCKAWYSYCDAVNGPADRLAARVPGSKDDFRERLDAASKESSGDESDE